MERVGRGEVTAGTKLSPRRGEMGRTLLDFSRGRSDRRRRPPAGRRRAPTSFLCSPPVFVSPGRAVAGCRLALEGIQQWPRLDHPGGCIESRPSPSPAPKLPPAGLTRHVRHVLSTDQDGVRLLSSKRRWGRGSYPDARPRAHLARSYGPSTSLASVPPVFAPS